MQFLPQDKVSEFAKMDPIRLLEETEKAADNGLYELHQDLDKASKDVKGLDTVSPLLLACFLHVPLWTLQCAIC